MIKVVITDWSGVISDDFDVVYSTTRNLFSRLGMTLMRKEKFREVFDLPYMDFYRFLGINISKDKLDKMYREIFLKSRKKAKLMPHAKKTLEWIDRKGVIICVFSSHPQELLDMDLRETGLARLFRHTVGGVHDKRKSLDSLIGKLDAERNEIVFVGDMAHDIEAGNQAGILTAAVLSGYQGRKRLEEKQPNFLLTDIRDMRYVIEGWYA